MKNRDITYFVNDIQPLEFCGKPVLWHLVTNGAFELPFEIEPTIGADDFTTCERCMGTLTELTKRLTEKFNGKEQRKGFPLCCSHHFGSKLSLLPIYSRSLQSLQLLHSLK